MYIIKYKNRIATYPERPEPDTTPEPTYELQDIEYIVYTAEDKDYWLDVIQKSYGEWGEVTVEEVAGDKPLTEEEKAIQKLKTELEITQSVLDNIMLMGVVQ